MLLYSGLKNFRASQVKEIFFETFNRRVLMRSGMLKKGESRENRINLVVTSVWLPVKMCSWDRYFTYLAWNVFPSPNIRFQYVMFLSDMFSKEALIPMRYPEDAFFDLIVKSIQGAKISSIESELLFGSYLRQCQRCYTFLYQSFH